MTLAVGQERYLLLLGSPVAVDSKSHLWNASVDRYNDQLEVNDHVRYNSSIIRCNIAIPRLIADKHEVVGRNKYRLT
jgi:hypothetical protein